MDEHDDPELLRRLQEGDQEALAILVARHQGLVAAACRRGAPPGEADDCAQAVFLVLARRPQAAARAPLAPWLLRTAALVCRCARRGAERRRRAERQAPPPEPAPARNEALDHLDDCLQRLPERQRLAVSLHYLTGVPADDIAARLGTSRANAYQLLSRGLAGLRALLARRGVAIPAAGLAALLAGEAQAAAAPVAGTTLVALTTGAPSHAAGALSQEALRAMTLHAILPAAVGGTLVAAALAAAISVVAIRAPAPEPDPSETGRTALVSTHAVPAPPTTTAWQVQAKPTQDPPGRNPLPIPAPPADILEQQVSLDFQAIDMQEIASFLDQLSGGKIRLLPPLPSSTVSIRVRGMKMGDVLFWMARLTDRRLEWKGEGFALVPAGDGATGGDGVVDPGPRESMEAQQVTAELHESDPGEACAFLQNITNTNLVIHPRAFQAGRRITVSMTNRSAIELAEEIARQAGCDLLERNGAIGFMPRGAGQPVPPTGRF
jgi:RNA polymerase sigma factor (sigma-70 family)